MADKMLRAYQKNVKEEAEAAGTQIDSDDENFGIDDEGKDATELKVLEDFVAANHGKIAKISPDYKVFDVVTSKNPSQILRYSQ